MSKIKEFASLYLAYRRFHPMRYAVCRAYGIAFKGHPF